MNNAMDLNEIEHLAIRRRFQGVTYADISEEIDVPQRTVEGWFTRDGKLHDHFQEYSYEMGQEWETADKDIREKILDLAPKALNRIAAIIDDPKSPKHFEACREMLHMAGLKDGIPIVPPEVARFTRYIAEQSRPKKDQDN